MLSYKTVSENKHKMKNKLYCAEEQQNIKWSQNKEQFAGGYEQNVLSVPRARINTNSRKFGYSLLENWLFYAYQAYIKTIAIKI